MATNHGGCGGERLTSDRASKVNLSPLLLCSLPISGVNEGLVIFLSPFFQKGFFIFIIPAYISAAQWSGSAPRVVSGPKKHDWWRVTWILLWKWATWLRLMRRSVSASMTKSGTSRFMYLRLAGVRIQAKAVRTTVFSVLNHLDTTLAHRLTF